MSAASSVSISGSVTGLDSGSETISFGPYTNAISPKARLTQRINATFAAITFPALVGSEVIKGVFIVPLNGSGTITLKGVTGDTGTPIATDGATFLKKPSITASDFGIATTTDVTFLFLFV